MSSGTVPAGSPGDYQAPDKRERADEDGGTGPTAGLPAYEQEIWLEQKAAENGGDLPEGIMPPPDPDGSDSARPNRGD